MNVEVAITSTRFKNTNLLKETYQTLPYIINFTHRPLLTMTLWVLLIKPLNSSMEFVSIIDVILAHNIFFLFSFDWDDTLSSPIVIWFLSDEWA